MTVHYPWHPAYGSEIPIVYWETRRGERVLVTILSDGTRGVVPAWMLDRDLCGAMGFGQPVAAASALADLRRILDGLKLAVEGPTIVEDRGHEKEPIETVHKPRPDDAVPAGTQTMRGGGGSPRNPSSVGDASSPSRIDRSPRSGKKGIEQ